jgi:hypothetical protein
MQCFRVATVPLPFSLAERLLRPRIKNLARIKEFGPGSATGGRIGGSGPISLDSESGGAKGRYPKNKTSFVEAGSTDFAAKDVFFVWSQAPACASAHLAILAPSVAFGYSCRPGRRFAPMAALSAQLR